MSYNIIVLILLMLVVMKLYGNCGVLLIIIIIKLFNYCVAETIGELINPRARMRSEWLL